MPQEDVCGICRQAFESTCNACKMPGDECPLIVGKCRHYFHMHCLMRWISTEASGGSCPMCRTRWKTQTDKDNEEDDELEDTPSSIDVDAIDEDTMET